MFGYIKLYIVFFHTSIKTQKLDIINFLCKWGARLASPEITDSQHHKMRRRPGGICRGLWKLIGRTGIRDVFDLWLQIRCYVSVFAEQALALFCGLWQHKLMHCFILWSVNETCSTLIFREHWRTIYQCDNLLAVICLSASERSIEKLFVEVSSTEFFLFQLRCSCGCW